MTATVTPIARARAVKNQRFSKAALERLAQDLGSAWVHTCPVAGVTGLLLNDHACRWCRATAPGIKHIEHIDYSNTPLPTWSAQ